MIRQTLQSTQDATFCILFHDANSAAPLPSGTGFFVSPDGYFVTAAHVVKDSATSSIRDVSSAWLKKETRVPGGPAGALCEHLELVHIDESTDFALLKANFQENSNAEWLTGRTTFPYLTVSARALVEGEPVYSFGYPLSERETLGPAAGGSMIGVTKLSPRVTAAIIASSIETSGLLISSSQARVYVLDRALNYGNSGGPIVASESGRVHALCSRFQPVRVPQPHLMDKSGRVPFVWMPSLYGIVSSLGNASVVKKLLEVGVPVMDH